MGSFLNCEAIGIRYAITANQQFAMMAYPEQKTIKFFVKPLNFMVSWFGDAPAYYTKV